MILKAHAISERRPPPEEPSLDLVAGTHSSLSPEAVSGRSPVRDSYAVSASG